MSRKDYIEIATILNEAPRTIEGIYFIAIRMARMFKNDNPNFRPIQFFEACGYATKEAGELAAKL